MHAFGDGVFEVVENEPERLREVEGIGAKRVEQIVAGLAEQKAIHEIMLFLHSHGVGTARAVQIHKAYGNDALRIISKNPYQLAHDIRGIGFPSADQVAEKLGIEKISSIRVRAGISYALSKAMASGHCGLAADELMAEAAKLIEVPAELIVAALRDEMEAGTVVQTPSQNGPACFWNGFIGQNRPLPPGFTP